MTVKDGEKNVKSFKTTLFVFVKWAFFLFLFFSAVLFLYTFLPFSEPNLNYGISSVEITDRNDIMLRRIVFDGRSVSSYCSIDEISDKLQKATVAIEDVRFYRHRGIDLYGVARAVLFNIKHGRIEEGASTLSQQLAGMIFATEPGTFSGKIKKMMLAMRIERQLSKQKILELYLNRAPYGPNVYGIKAACEDYFQCRPSELSLAQAAFLASIPQRPAFFDPRNNFESVMSRQRLVLKAMLRSGLIDDTSFKSALEERITISPFREFFAAPHFCDYILSGIGNDRILQLSKVKTTLDLQLQRDIEKLVRSGISSLAEKGVTNGAAVVMNRNGEILAMVGSVDYWGKNGQVNATDSPRQGGSILKPFTYAMAIDNKSRISDIVPDLPLDIPQKGGLYIPANYDNKFHGPVSLREALACSYNIPAVMLLRNIGVDSLYSLLVTAGFSHIDHEPSYYGLGLTLGGAPVTLLELVGAYSVFINSGEIIERQIILDIYDRNGVKLPSGQTEKPVRLISSQAAFIIFDVLNDNSAREKAFGRSSALLLPFACAVKTGTSKSFRDNWTVGCTADYVVGVWAGNFDNSEMKGVSGVTGAAPVFNQIVSMLHSKKHPDSLEAPAGIVSCRVCSLSGEVPGPYCAGKIRPEYYISGNEPDKVCSVHRLLPVDTRTGALASPSTPEKYVIERIYEIYPPLYNHWMAEKGFPVPLGELSDGFEKSSFFISFPSDGTSFRIDPILRKDFQKIHFRLAAARDAGKVTWFLNGRKLGNSDWPYNFEWQLEKGRYLLEVKSSKNKASCSFSVY